MASHRVRPALNGADGYMRWKESMLLALHSARVAHVLYDDPPPFLDSGSSGNGTGPTAAAVAVSKQWARDDAVCRGHILAGLSERILRDYVHHVTGKALWKAVERTYGVDSPSIAWRHFTGFAFVESQPILEQIAHAEALGVAGHGTLADGVVAGVLCEKLPATVRDTVKMWSSGDQVTMDTVWAISRAKEDSRLEKVAVHAAAETSSPKEYQE
jgi:hypothetical protein